MPTGARETLSLRNLLPRFRRVGGTTGAAYGAQVRRDASCPDAPGAACPWERLQVGGLKGFPAFWLSNNSAPLFSNCRESWARPPPACPPPCPVLGGAVQQGAQPPQGPGTTPAEQRLSPSEDAPSLPRETPPASCIVPTMAPRLSLSAEALPQFHVIQRFLPQKD